MPPRITAILLLAAALALPAELTYQKPPQEILDVLNAPPPPAISVNPSRDYAILMQPLRYPRIAEVAQPMLRLAGLRIDIRTNGPHLPFSSTAYTIKRLADASDIRVAAPPDAKLGAPVWSPDGKQFAFTNTTANAIELWIGTTATGRTRRGAGVLLNAVMGPPIVWLADSRTLILRAIPEGRGEPPADAAAPTGPHVQESSGRAGPRTGRGAPPRRCGRAHGSARAGELRPRGPCGHLRRHAQHATRRRSVRLLRDCPTRVPGHVHG